MFFLRLKPLSLLVATAAIGIVGAGAAHAEEAAAASTISAGDTAWLLISCALVMLMTPGLAFFYAGMVRRKNVVSTLFKNYLSLAVAGVLWAIVGYSIAFSEGSPFFGSFSTYFMLNGVGQESGPLATTVPHLAFMAFQMMFAVITPALMIGSFVERASFKAWLLILAAWSLLVYAPLAHWVWHPTGWIAASGALDFAGGLVVHVSAGVSALVAAVMFGRRIESSEPARPNDVSLIMLGAALLWFGWFGFNAGSAISAGGLSAHAFVTTFLAAATAFLSWMAYDWIRLGKPSAVGSAIGLVVGLVVITPAAGYVSVQAAMLMGLIGGVVCNFVTHTLKSKTKLDDSLDVFACHGAGGILGALMTGLFASSDANSVVVNAGLLVGGDATLLKANAFALAATILFAAVATYIIIKIVSMVTTLRVTEDEELAGLDTAVHGEIARYHDSKRAA